MIEEVHPRSLLSRRRLDLVIKHRFFRHLNEGGDPYAERLYLWHIDKRTGGNEPKNESKNCLTDYLREAQSLLSSLKSNGFDPRYPIPLDQDGSIRNGAHRISACLLLDIPVLVERLSFKKRARTWSYSWFVENGMSEPDLADLVARWELLSGGEFS